jgi:hypothetical protein
LDSEQRTSARPRAEAARSSWERLAPASGLLFVGLSLTAWLLFIGAPGVDGSAADVVTFVEGHRTRLLAAALLAGLALVPFLSFLGVLFTCLHGVGALRLGVIALCGGLVSGVLFVLIVAIPAALAFNIASTADPQLVKAIYDLDWPLQVLVPFPSAVLVGAVSVTFLRSKVFPDGIGWGGIGSAIVVLIGGTTWSKTGYWSPSHGYGYAALFVFLSWIAVSSVLLLWRARNTDEPKGSSPVRGEAAAAPE